MTPAGQRREFTTCRLGRPAQHGASPDPGDGASTVFGPALSDGPADEIWIRQLMLTNHGPLLP